MTALRASGPKPVVLAPVRPNLGIEAAYRRRLDAEIEAMQADILAVIDPEYAEKVEFAADEAPARALQSVMGKLRRKWQRRFDQLAPDLAAYFSTASTARASGAMSAILLKAGFAVKFKLTAEMRDILIATTAENVSLIRSIPSEHFTQIEGMVMRSVAVGRDLKTLTADLQAEYGVTKRRAVTIARDQNNKATATVTKARQEELGLHTARWLHSAGGKTPRPKHVAFAAGRDGGPFYDVRVGALIEGRRIWPGTEINCRCVSRTVVMGFG